MKKFFGPAGFSFAAALLLGAGGGNAAAAVEDIPANSAAQNVNAAGYTLTVNKNDHRGTWQGWGCSLAWWGKGVGGSSFEDLYADLFFSRRTVAFMGKDLPGLGFNIVRYNVGGGGHNETIATTHENVPDILPWFRDIDGFWINWASQDPDSNSWDWSRDTDQLRILRAAIRRGVDHVEFFSNAPMWWMMDSKSSAGGHLQAWNRRDFAVYLANVVQHARDNWGVPVTSVEPFNEPSAGWWNFPKNQEGCNLPRAEQAEVLGYLREELDRRGLNSVPITASDENSMQAALETHNDFKNRPVMVRGRNRNVAALIGKVNVHGYSGLQPWRDNGGREALRQSVGTTPLWMSEYGDNDGSGMAMAQSITEDINFLRPTAWIYWQPVEPASAWGLVNGNFEVSAERPDRAAPTWVYAKYYVLAQFTRFLRPGYQVIGSDDHNTITAYDAAHHRLVLITVNYGNAQPIKYDLSGLAQVGTTAAVTATNTSGSSLMRASTLPVAAKRFVLAAEANSIYSVVVDGVTLRGAGVLGRPVSFMEM